MTEPSTSAVDLAVTARIQAARRRTEDMRRQRAELAEARRAGLAHRHARKLKNLAAAEQRAQQQTLDEDDGDGQDDEQHDHRASVRTTDGSAADIPSAANDTTEGVTP